MAIIRWIAEYAGTSAQKAREFIDSKLDKVVGLLLKIRADSSYDSKADAIKKMTLAGFMNFADEVN